MTIDERLKYCRICENRKVNLAIGLFCGLTNEKPNFEPNCPNFKIDQPEAPEGQRLVLAVEDRLCRYVLRTMCIWIEAGSTLAAAVSCLAH